MFERVGAVANAVWLPVHVKVSRQSRDGADPYPTVFYLVDGGVDTRPLSIRFNEGTN